MTERRGIYREYIQILPAAEQGAQRPIVSADELGARLGSPPPAERAVETFVRVGAPERAPERVPEPAAPPPQPAAAALPAPVLVEPAATVPAPIVAAADRGAAIPATGDAPLLPRRAWFADKMTLAAAAAALVLASAALAWQIAVRSHVETETAALQSSVSELKQRLAVRESRPTMPPSRYAERAHPPAQGDHTHSIPAPPAAALPPPRPAAATVPLRPRIEPEGAQPAIAEDWVLREVFRGRALVEGRRGFFEVAVGTPLPGLGRVEAIEQRNGRMVVVTERGLIVAAY